MITDNTPQGFAERLYSQYSEFENLSVDEVKRCCDIALRMAMESADGPMRLYYDMVRHYLKEREVMA